MLLNPNDFRFQYFRQKRGHEGDSGSLYLGTPISGTGFKPILVKSYLVSDAINEYIGCNLGQRLGINTPKAWLFKADSQAAKGPIDFTRAVGIEYLDGMDEGSTGFFDNRDLTVQTLKGIMLHKMMSEEDQSSIAFYDGKVYAFDFASSMYPQYMGTDILDIAKAELNGSGLSFVDKILIDFKKSVIKSLKMMDLAPPLSEIPGKLYQKAFLEIQGCFFDEYHKNRFADLLEEVDIVFSTESAKMVDDFLTRMLYVMESINIDAAKYVLNA